MFAGLCEKLFDIDQHLKAELALSARPGIAKAEPDRERIAGIQHILVECRDPGTSSK